MSIIERLFVWAADTVNGDAARGASSGLRSIYRFILLACDDRVSSSKQSSNSNDVDSELSDNIDPFNDNTYSVNLAKPFSGKR